MNETVHDLTVTGKLIISGDMTVVDTLVTEEIKVAPIDKDIVEKLLETNKDFERKIEALEEKVEHMMHKFGGMLKALKALNREDQDQDQDEDDY